MRFFAPIGRLFCKDGYSLSVQANENMYCSPRTNPAKDVKYDCVEVGYVMDTEENHVIMPESWHVHADNLEDNKTSNVYAYVPVELVEQFIQEHGGLDIGKTLSSIQKETRI